MHTLRKDTTAHARGYKACAVFGAPRPRIVRMELRHRALQVLCLADPDQKAAAALALHETAATLSIAPEPVSPPPDEGGLPGRPERPVLLRHTDVARRSPATPEGRA